MSTEILAAIEQHADATNSAINETNERVSRLNDMVIDLAQKSVSGFAVGFGGNQNQKTGLAGMIEKSGELNALRNRSTKSVQIPLNIAIKALVGDGGTTSNTHFDVQAQRGSQIGEDARRRLSLLDVLPSIPVTSGSFEFIQLDSYTNAAGYQENQGDKKATQDTESQVKTANIATIALTERVSEQVLADSPALGHFLSSRMQYNVKHKLEAELIAGTGGTGKIKGLVQSGTVFTPSAPSGLAPVDCIGEAISRLDATGWQAGVVLLHPNDFQAMRAERSNDGIYLAGSWREEVAPNIYGVPVVTTPAVSEGTGIVLDTNQVLLLDRQDAVFAFGYDDDGFSRNFMTARAELRAGLAVLSPSAVLTVNIA